MEKPYDQDQSGHTVFFLQIPACNRAKHTFRMKYGIVDRHTHDMCRERSDDIDVRSDFADRTCIDGIAICHGVHRADGAGVSIVCHGCDFAQRGLVHLCVGDDRTDGRVCVG